MSAPVPDENVPLLDELSRLFILAEAALRKMKSPRGVWLSWSDSDSKRTIGFDKDDDIG